MFDSAILDIAISLIFIYLLLSLIITAANEVIETAIKLRADQLSKGIVKLLGRKKAKDFFEHALIKGLSPDKWFGSGTRRPSYIPSRTFAATVLDIVVSGELPKSIENIRAALDGLDGEDQDLKDLKNSLRVLLDEARYDPEKFEENIEIWFNNQMERVGGWYKRKIQLMTLAIAILVTIAMNVDTIRIVQTLSNDSVLRKMLVAQAQELVKQSPQISQPSKDTSNSTDAAKELESRFAALQNNIKNVQGLGLPIGWSDELPQLGPLQLFEIFMGWLLTALAISLGAPFWFDMLNKVVSIRSSGKAPEEKPKSPKAEPKPLAPGETPEEQRNTETR